MASTYPPIAASMVTAPAFDGFTVVPSDTVNHANGAVPRALYIGGAGNIVIVTPGAGNVLTLNNVQAGSIIPIASIRVNNTNTTATNIVALI